MNYRIILFFFVSIITTCSFAQGTNELKKGTISFISSQHIYVLFENTSNINRGDTLYKKENEKLSPVLIVNTLSSSSCMCSLLGNSSNTLKLNDEIVFKLKSTPQIAEVKAQSQPEAIDINQEILQNQNESKKHATDLSGHISVSSYSYAFNDSIHDFTQRIRYTAALDINHIAGTNLSAESYLTYTQKIGETSAITDALKIYSLALNYKISDNFRISAGRKINSYIANIGAMDGVQAEYTKNSISAGIVAGFRPDYYTYGLNTDLLQYGAYVGHSYKKEHSFMKTSLALFNQTSNNSTYRRFAYIQHSNSLLRNLDFFGSAELDFYSVENGVASTTFDLTSLYLSLRYRPFRNLSLSTSYDARKNVYYYETYKNFIDSLVDRETRQGFKFLATYRPFNKLSVTGSAGFKTANQYSSNSFNANTYVTYSQLPFIDAVATIDATYLKTDYANGLIYGGGLSKDFADGNLNTEITYKYVDYTFNNTGSTLNQHIGNFNISWRVLKKLYLSADFEGVLDSYSNLDGRLFINLSYRF